MSMVVIYYWSSDSRIEDRMSLTAPIRTRLVEEFTVGQGCLRTCGLDKYPLVGWCEVRFRRLGRELEGAQGCQTMVELRPTSPAAAFPGCGVLQKLDQ